MIMHRERYGMNTKLQKFSRMKARTKKQRKESWIKLSAQIIADNLKS